MAKSLSAILMAADLRRSDDEQPGLDRPSAQQDMPMCLPVGTVKAAGTTMTSASDSASRAKSAGKRRS